MSSFKAFAYLYNDDREIRGNVMFTQQKGRNRVMISIMAAIEELKPKLKNQTTVVKRYHGFHIHKSGDMSRGCASMGPHYNPEFQDHGGRSSKVRHVGDMGNVRSDNGYIDTTFYLDNPGFSLDPDHERTIVGRGVVLHMDRDDCGKGNDKESKITGNSGARIMCGPIFQVFSM